MSRIGAIVRKLYADEVKTVAGRAVGVMDERWTRRKRKFQAFKRAITSRRAVLWLVRIVVVVVALVILAESVFQFNRLTSSYTTVLAREADVDREVQRRVNLIPNMVQLVGQYAGYERAVLKHVSDARAALKSVPSFSIADTGVASALSKALSGLVALSEEYPDLKATQPIQNLLKEATNTEDRIAEAKQEYSKAAEAYNQYRTIVPGNVFAMVFGFGPADYIGLDEAVDVPVMDLKMTEELPSTAQRPASKINRCGVVPGCIRGARRRSSYRESGVKVIPGWASAPLLSTMKAGAFFVCPWRWEGW